MRALSGDDVLQLGRLYRIAASTLARLQAAGAHTPAEAGLNRLVAQAYQILYSEPRRAGGFWEFVLQEIPHAVRANGSYVLLAIAALLLGMSVAWFKTDADPLAAEILVGKRWSASIEQIGARHREQQDWLPEDARSVAGSFIVVNNVQVALITFALGSIAGVGSLFMVLRTGAMLGAVGAGVSAAAASGDFWAFVAPHGVPEITAIILAGAAGLRLGWTIIDPGEYSRGYAFTRAGYDALRLLMAAVLLLVWAAAVESFISPTMLPYGLKYGVAASEALVMLLYIARGGRQTASEAQGPEQAFR